MADPHPPPRAWRSMDDLARMQALASRRLEHDWPAVRIHPGDLDWWAIQAWGRGPEQPDLAERVRLWPGDPAAPADVELLGFAWFTPPGDLDIVLDAALGEADRVRAGAIVGEALAWGAARRDRWAAGRGEPVLAWAAQGSLEAALLEGLGHLPRSEGRAYVELTGRTGGGAVGPVEPPAGLVVRPLTHADVAARVVCSRAAFTTSTMTPERYRRTFLAHLYRPELDLLVLDDAGAVVAFALGWYDEATSCVELEPVGVHPDRHRMGLGTLVCRAVIAASRDLGASRVLISAERDNAAAVGLYRSLGLSVTSTIVPFVAS